MENYNTEETWDPHFFRSIGSAYSSDTVDRVVDVSKWKKYTANEIATLLTDGTDIHQWLKRHEPNFIMYISVPKFDCTICDETFGVHEMYTVSCNQSHRFCYGCITKYVKVKLQGGELITCAAANCQYNIKPQELLELKFTQNEVKSYNDLLLKNILEANCIACPEKNCQQYFYPSSPGKQERVHCNGCNMIFCSMCKRTYHYQIECKNVLYVTQTWLAWNNKERDKYWSLRNKEKEQYQKYLDARQQNARENQEKQIRYQELVNDEQWKANKCRLCPKCGRVVEKIEGCNSMVCGKDAHGGNLQAGCGFDFCWGSAAPYIASAAAFNLEEFKMVIPQTKKETVHLYFKCDICGNEPRGLMFTCLHCESYHVCENCEATKLGKSHNTSHVFTIVQ